jgi:glycerate dehydrogenase
MSAQQLAVAVVLNAARLDFDHALDFSALEAVVEVRRYEETSNKDDVLEKVQGSEIVITKEMELTEEMILGFPPSVRVIIEAGTGVNNINMPAAKAKDILVCNVPAYSTDAVASLVITSILNFSSSIIEQQAMIRAGNFDNFNKCLQVPHFEVSGRTLGLIGGTGAIGRKVCDIAVALGMKVLMNSRSLEPESHPSVDAAQLDDLLKHSDFVSIHCPLSSATHHLIDAAVLEKMKPSAFIINTARGAIIKEVDLIEALKKGTIAGAALDVTDPEPPAMDSPLFSMRNVVITPHIGWKRKETRQRLVNAVAENVICYQRGQPINVVSSTSSR